MRHGVWLGSVCWFSRRSPCFEVLVRLVPRVITVWQIYFYCNRFRDFTRLVDQPCLLCWPSTLLVIPDFIHEFLVGTYAVLTSHNTHLIDSWVQETSFLLFISLCCRNSTIQFSWTKICKKKQLLTHNNHNNAGKLSQIFHRLFHLLALTESHKQQWNQ